mgnify:CR=1 FL=1
MPKFKAARRDRADDESHREEHRKRDNADERCPPQTASRRGCDLRIRGEGGERRSFGGTRADIAVKTTIGTAKLPDETEKIDRSDKGQSGERRHGQTEQQCTRVRHGGDKHDGRCLNVGDQRDSGDSTGEHQRRRDDGKSPQKDAQDAEKEVRDRQPRKL